MLTAILVYTIVFFSFFLSSICDRYITCNVSQPTILISALINSFPICVFTILIGLRYNVGGDYWGYTTYFELQPYLRPNEVPYELGFYALIEVLHFFNLNSQSLFFITALIQSFLLIKIINLLKRESTFVILFYFVLLSFIESLNTIRQSIALLAVIIAVVDFKDKKHVSGFVYACVAISFHTSALIAIPILIFLSFFKLARFNKTISLMIITSLVLKKKIVEVLFSMLPGTNDGAIYLNYLAAREDLQMGQTSGVGMALYLSILVDLYIVNSASRLLFSFDSKAKYLFSSFAVGAVLSPVVVEANFITFSRALMYFYGLKFIVLGAIIHYGFLSKCRLESSGFVCFALTFVYFVWFFNAVLKGAALSAPFQFFGIV